MGKNVLPFSIPPGRFIIRRIRQSVFQEWSAVLLQSPNVIVSLVLGKRIALTLFS